MAWYDEAVFYHIYPLGLLGAPEKNKYAKPISKIKELNDWIGHIKELGCNALYIGPLFESGSHGYDTTDYKKLDSRLGTNEDLKAFVKTCHDNGIRVIFDGVFNHTGRDFFAFQDLKEHREASLYKDWYCNVNFWGNNEYNDGFSYDNWSGYNLLVKLNQKNPAVREYLLDVVRFWVNEFDIDGIRLDAADVLDFNFMHELRMLANTLKADFWLMGEVIHGEYSRWVNDGMLHAVTNYNLHKALYSGHNDHNYFEIAHTVKRLYDMIGSPRYGKQLYSFVDNHDVERICSKLNDKSQFYPVHILLYTLPGIPSIYYGSEFAIEGRKCNGSDAPLRPCIELSSYKSALEENPYTKLIAALGRLRANNPILAYGDYEQLLLTNRQYAFARSLDGKSILTIVNNDENPASLTIPAQACDHYLSFFSGQTISSENGNLTLTIPAHFGEILLPEGIKNIEYREKLIPKAASLVQEIAEFTADQAKAPEKNDLPPVPNKPYEEMTIEELQAAILEKMAKNGPVTEEMKRTVFENVYHNSLLNWVKSFR
jgi:cyclomaltodextrinase / maltogenic alpha-amylase / neopullulanase